jgi:hypothetical protein
MRRRSRCRNCGLPIDYPDDCACVPDLDSYELDPDYGGAFDGVNTVFSDAGPGL